MVEKLEAASSQETVHYRLYKRRFIGATALCLLNCLGGMSGSWFSAIALDTAEAFNISVSRVNWLSNATNVVFICSAFAIPWAVRKLGIRLSCIICAGIQLVAAWIRYAGTARSLSPDGAFALMMVSQLMTGTTQAVWQVLAPRYSEAWFGLKGRVTATMIMTLLGPVGNAIGQLLAPIGTVRTSILILSIATTVIAPSAFALGERPPTPPTFSGSKTSPPVFETIRRMSWRERCDFAILVWGFGVLDGVIVSLLTLVAQVYGPYGYDSSQSGFLGAALLISGIVAALITAPLFDRVLTHHLARTIQVVVPVLAGCWLGFIWAVGTHGLKASYALLVVIGICSFTLLPVTLELACEVTRHAELSGAMLWLSANAVGLFLVLISDLLKAGPNANPPYNLKKQLILHAAFALSIIPLTLCMRGKQVRREMDEKENARDEQAAGEANREE
ncbi:hypothetical protein M407DRAFT_220760 [Tulasnella calospora MUT 4182]|uniref:Major facilitator superfamily (MFS) profile domain-containing protein n=1 Tax=Tulasnella calospora MUT 4182 TaxID=1051891 RepID=A0A0C3LFX0_9AGAM|nr:hypothetical protein M407DRAFT_84233 [Tulasnella calospora MUT 4182]KIO20327.1 hypothetical protein M407DRAFT_220760 [Tulasnella calospora MUT 4182]